MTNPTETQNYVRLKYNEIILGFSEIFYNTDAGKCVLVSTYTFVEPVSNRIMPDFEKNNKKSFFFGFEIVTSR